MLTRHPPKTHTARRDYTCAECGEGIPTNTTYDAQTIIDRTVITTRRTHTLCTPTLPGDPFS